MLIGYPFIIMVCYDLKANKVPKVNPMSPLQEQLKTDMKDAMKAKDVFKRDALRFLLSALKQIEVDERRELSDEDVQKVLQKLLKQRHDAAEQFKDAGRDDLVEKEVREATLLQTYLPAQLSDDELQAIVQEVIAKVGATTMQDIGKVMGMAMKASEGKADGKRINAVAKALLS